jgi:hypothetical protein
MSPRGDTIIESQQRKPLSNLNGGYGGNGNGADGDNGNGGDGGNGYEQRETEKRRHYEWPARLSS